MSETYALAGCTVRINGSTVETTLPNGDRVLGMPMHDQAYLATARRLGYGSNVARLNVEHELTHTLVAHWLGVPCSPVFRRIASGDHEADQSHAARGGRGAGGPGIRRRDRAGPGRDRPDVGPAMIRRPAKEPELQQPAVDHGTTGRAMRVRPSRIIETIQAGITARTYEDSHLIDRMHRACQLSDPQFKAAQRVLEMHDAAGFEPSVTSGYAPPGWHIGHDDEAPEARAVTKFRHLLGDCSRAAADILHSMCLGHHPGVWRLATLQATLSDLAKRWGDA